MAPKRKASQEFDTNGKVRRIGEETSPTFANTGAGRQHVNTGEGKQYVADTMNFYKEQRDYGVEHFECLKNLLRTDPRVHKSVIEDTKGQPLKQSYKHILDNSDFEKWSKDEHSGIFWIRGSPGKGKTMLVCGIIDTLGEETAECPLSYFFCQSNDSELDSATAVLHGLIYLLAIQERPLLEHLQERYNLAGGRLFDSRDTFFVLAEVFKSMLRVPRATPSTPIYLIVDALDECSIDQKKLLGLIHQTSKEFTCVKWIVSSRTHQEIEEEMENAQNLTALNLDRNEAEVSTAVKTFIEDQVSQLAKRKKYNPQLQRTVKEYLQDHANDTFLWVSLVCQSLSKISARRTPEKLCAFPAGLHSFYREMLNQMLERADADDLATCKAILAVLLVTYRPVTLEELPCLVDLPPEFHDNPEWLEELIKVCGSFLIVREGTQTIYFVHQSAREYLETNAGAEVLHSQPAVRHYDIFSRSLKVMTATLERDIYKQKDPGVSVGQIKIVADRLKAVRYSCTYWASHFRAAVEQQTRSQDLNSDGCLDKFLKKLLLCWMEALSLMQRISDSVVAITDLEAAVMAINADQEILDLVKDARRFILQNHGLIEDTPLQTYTSALLFSPTRSKIRAAFECHEPAWISTKPVVEDYWGPCIQTLKGGHADWVKSVALSPDQAYLASASSDRLIKIWNTATAGCQKTLGGHGSCVNSLVFSHDGQLLASASSDKTIRLWNTKDWSSTRTLDGHGASVNSVLFSPDGKNLISASSDRTVRIWNVSDGKEIQMLRGHSDWVHQVAYPGDGNPRRLASASSDRTIRVWDLDKGKEASHVLKGHEDWVSSIAFQPGSAGALLASASYDKSVRLWDLETGSCLRIFEGHSDWIRSVAFSPNGQRLASASDDTSIRIWDPSDGGAGQQVFNGHGAAVTSLLFAPDGDRLISASQDRTIKLWDTTLGRDTEVLDFHHSRVDLVNFSPDGGHIASVSDDMTVKIWKATGECLQTLGGIDGHTQTVNSAVFSPCGHSVASASSDKTVKIWEVATGLCMKTLGGHDKWVEPIEYSPDGRWVVSGSGDTSVKIWDVATGECLRTLTGHKDGIRSVVFSHDGKHVASASTDRTARAWDTATGQGTLVLDGYSDWVTSVIFSLDDKYVAASSADHSIRIRALDITDNYNQILTGHSDLVHAICFSQDAKLLASAAADGEVRIWTIDTGECIRSTNVAVALKRISFDLANPDVYCLLTDIGRLELGHLKSDHSNSPVTATRSITRRQGHRWRGYGLSSDLLWVTCHGRDVLRLPSEYRVASHAVYKSTVVIGCDSGRLIVLGFTPNQFPHLRPRADYLSRSTQGSRRRLTLAATATSTTTTTTMAAQSTPPTSPLFQDSSAFVSEPENLIPTGATAGPEQDLSRTHKLLPTPEEAVTRRLMSDLEVIKGAKRRYSRTPLYHAMKEADQTTALSLVARSKWFTVAEETVISHIKNTSAGYKSECLFKAIKRQREDEIGFLIEIGADLSVTGYGDWPGWNGTALHEAAWYGTPSIIELLLENGADKNARDIGGRKPAFVPNWARTEEIARLLS